MAPKKKSLTKSKSGHRASEKANQDALLRPALPVELTSGNGTAHEHQRVRNPYVPGEREKMLEKRKRLTLEAFRIAYENQHPRKRT